MHIVTTQQTSRPSFHYPEFFSSSSSTSLRYSHIHSYLLHMTPSLPPVVLAWSPASCSLNWELADNPGISLKPDQLTEGHNTAAQVMVPAQLQHANQHFYWMLHTKEPKNPVVYISEKLLNSSASSYTYSQVRYSIYKIKSSLNTEFKK